MTDNEIKKAIKRLQSTKDFLREQHQEEVKKIPYPEIKPLAKQTYEDNKRAFDIAIKAIEEYNHQQAEIERLNKLVVEKHTENNRLHDYLQYTRAEAFKEFANGLIDKAYSDGKYEYRFYVENYLKEKLEMVGED